MKIHETAKFNKLRTKLKEKIEKEALKEAPTTLKRARS
jgi:hypothetical protein